MNPEEIARDWINELKRCAGWDRFGWLGAEHQRELLGAWAAILNLLIEEASTDFTDYTDFAEANPSRFVAFISD